MAANPDDQQDFYASDLGPTRTLAVVAANAVSSAGATPGDPAGALPPGKYLLQRGAPGGADVMWIDAIPFKKADAAWTGMAAAAPAHPLIRDSLVLHVRKGHNDRIVARVTGGAGAALHITLISRVPKKQPPA
jgi:hypothetical protein